MPITVGSLFSGIGGLDLGLERAGMEIIWQMESDGYCQRVLAKHWPGVRRYGDIRKVDSGELERVDLVCGGFPCQPHSCAGKRKGSRDDRDLWPEMFRVIRGVKPAFVVAENVFGFMSIESGFLVERTYADLESAGYEVCPPLVFPALAVGAPHIRDRVWIVAYAKDNGLQERQGQNRQPVKGGVGQSGVDLAGEGAAIPDATGSGLQVGNGFQPGRPESHASTTSHCWWDTEPGVGRVAHGIPSRVDRLRGLGNAVVPPVAEWLGRRIIKAMKIS